MQILIDADGCPVTDIAVSLAKPVVIRYPRGGTNSAPAPVEFQHGKAVVRKDAGSSSPVIWASGAEVGTAMRVADILNSYGIECRVFDARFLKPFDSEKALQNAHCRHFVIEDHVIYSGLASALCEAFDNVAHAPVTAFGWSSDKIVPHGKISSLRHYSGLNAEQIAEKIRNICKNI